MVGHLTEDRIVHPAASEVSGEPRLGGAATYAGLLAHRFGVETTILTATDADFPFLKALRGIRVIALPSDERTRFENRYREDGVREQRVLSVAASIAAARIEQEVAELPHGSAVLYAPVANELEGNEPLPRPRGEDALAGAIPQGFLRQWDESGRITTTWPEGIEERLAGMDFIALAEEELPKRTQLTPTILAVTRGARGALLRRPGQPDLTIPAAAARASDPTGAGDVFAAALLVSLRRTVAPEAAARLAAAAAAMSVEAPGTDGVPRLEEATARARAVSE